MKLKLIKLAVFRKLNRTWTSLAAALLVGVLAALAARSLLGDRVDAIGARSSASTVEVVVARDALRQGSALSRQLLAVRQIPAQYAQSGAVRPQDFYRIEGRTVAYGLKGGDMLMWSHLESARAATFSERLAPGRRAVTVVVEEFNGGSAALQPGDLVDLMLSTERAGRKSVSALLQSVQVMATGQRTVDDPASGVTSRLATLTLDTTPEQARTLIIARETGRLTALLRNPYDKTAIAAAGPEASSVRADGPTRARRTAAVPVLYGEASIPGRAQPTAP